MDDEAPGGPASVRFHLLRGFDKGHPPMPAELQPPAQYDPWDQLPGEPAKLHARFWRFCQLGYSRSLLAAYNAELAEKGKTRKRRTPSSWDAACRTWRWWQRAEAWDAEQRRLFHAKMAERRDRMTENQATLGAALWGFAANDLEKVNPDDPAALNRLKWISEGVRIERLALGEPDTILKRQVEPDAQVNNQLTINVVDIVRQLKEAERQERERQEHLESQAEQPARIAYQASANGHQVNGRG